MSTETPIKSRKVLDQWYTPNDVARDCANIAKQYIAPSLIIEPSAGEGALSDAANTTFWGVTVQSFDLDPKRADIMQADFLELPIHTKEPNLH